MMTITSGSEQVVGERTCDDDDNLIHIMCCEDNDVSLCGVDISDAPIFPDGWYADDCIVCDHLGDLKKKARCLVCPRSKVR
jgi:hypothetical protein